MPDPESRRLIEVINIKDTKIQQLNQKIEGYKIKIKELTSQNVKQKEIKKEIEDLKRTKDQLEEEIVQLKEETEKLKKELEKKDVRMDSLENTIKANDESHRKEVEEMKLVHKDVICKLEERNAKGIQEVKENQNEVMKKMEEWRKGFQWNEEENKKLREENRELKNNSKANENITQDQHKLYLGQLCLEVQDNLYRYIMPENCCAQDSYYKIKDIEEDMNDKDLVTGEKRHEAVKKLQEIKKKIDWDKLKKLIGTMKLLQDTRNQVAHPPVDAEGAIRAAQELNKQGKLKGKTSFERVKQIIKIWSVLKSLLDDQVE